MPSDNQANRRQLRRIQSARQEQRGQDEPRLWAGYSKNNLGQVTSPSGQKSTGFVSGNASTSTGDPVCFIGQPGQPGIIVTQTVPTIFEWSSPPEPALAGLVFLNISYSDNTYDRYGIGPRIQVAPPADLPAVQDSFSPLIWADSNRDWYALAVNQGSGLNLVWINKGQASLVPTSADIQALVSVIIEKQGILANHYVQGFYSTAFAASALNTSHYIFNLRTGQASTHPLSGSLTKPAGSPVGTSPGRLAISGQVTIFEGLSLDATFAADYSADSSEENVDGPWPVPGATYGHYYYRHRTGGDDSNPIYSGGTGYSIGDDPCSPDFFVTLTTTLLSARPWQTNRALMPQGYGDRENRYIFVTEGDDFGRPFSDPAATIPLTGTSFARARSARFRSGNLVFFEELAVLDPFEQFIVSAVYPEAPSLPGTFYLRNFTPFSTAGFTLAYSDLRPCNDPRPYKRPVSSQTAEASGNLYLPIARNEDRVIYHAATDINYEKRTVDKPALSVSGISLTDREDYTEETWSSNWHCWLHDLNSGQRTDCVAYQPISLPFPSVDFVEVGQSYSFTYSNLGDGWGYRKFVPAPNNGTRREDRAAQGSPIESAVSSQWKTWFAGKVAGEIPVFGKVFGRCEPEGSSVKIFKGRLTAIAYNDSITNLRTILVPGGGGLSSDNGANWPVEITSFTIVFDEFLAEVGSAEVGFYFDRNIQGAELMDYVDLYRVNNGTSGQEPKIGGVAILDTGSFLNAGFQAFNDTPYDLAVAATSYAIDRSVKLANANYSAESLYSSLNSQSAAGLRYEWRTVKGSDGSTQDEVLVHYTNFGNEPIYSFYLDQLSLMKHPVRPDSKLYSLHPVFRLVEVDGMVETHFDRVELVPTSTPPALLEDNDFRRIGDSSIVPGY